MAEQLSLKELYQYTFATDERLAKMESGIPLDEEPDEFTAFYHRNGGVEKPVLVREVKEIIEEMKWSPLLDEGFERVAYLLEDEEHRIPVGETEDGKIYELSDGADGPGVHERVQIQELQE